MISKLKKKISKRFGIIFKKEFFFRNQNRKKKYKNMKEQTLKQEVNPRKLTSEHQKFQ